MRTLKSSLLLCTIVGMVISSCGSNTLVISSTNTPIASPTTLPIATSIPALPTKETEVHTDLVSINSLKVGEYLVIRGIDSHNGEDGLSVITSEGLYVGKLAEGRNFAYATVSPNHEWLAYIGSDYGVGTLRVERIDGRQSLTLADGCTDPSWSPDSQYLTAACGNILAFAFQEGEWKQIGMIPLPSEFVDLPDDAKENVQLASPTWSGDGKSIAYTAIFLAMPPASSVLGPYISPVSCLFDETTCNTYKLDIGKIHPWPVLQWLPLSNRIAIYSFPDNSGLYSFDAATKKLAETILLSDKDLIDSWVFSPSEKFLAVKPSTDSAFILNIGTKEIFELSRFQSEGTHIWSWIEISQ
ncbi:MAG TPA: hypothetical protein VK206_25960 [Anaerolineales bacterium]|nr:hypothetical protein [Anaerolineales bacterium]